MEKVKDPLEAASDTESIIQEYRERLNRALEVEGSKLKERAEQDSKQIIAGAREEADRVVAQAKEEARAESERIIAVARKEAEQTAGKSREEAAEARRESARIIDEAREKASQIILEAVERAAEHTRGEFARAASEAMSRTSLLLTGVSKSVEQIIGEAETNIKAELERFATIIDEAEIKRQLLGAIKEKEPEASSKQEAEEAVLPEVSDTGKPEPAVSVSEKTAPAAPSAGYKRNAAAGNDEDARLFKGCVRLEIIPPFNQEHTAGVPEWLARLPGLKIKSTGNYAGGNRRIETHDIDLAQPMPLLKIFKNMPPVKSVDENKGNIVITLK